MHFWMNVNRACISSFTEEAFVVCVHAHQVAFMLPEMLHTGGRNLRFHASWWWLPFSVSFAFYSSLLMNYCCFWNSGLRFSYPFFCCSIPVHLPTFVHDISCCSFCASGEIVHIWNGCFGYRQYFLCQIPRAVRASSFLSLVWSIPPRCSYVMWKREHEQVSLRG